LKDKNSKFAALLEESFKKRKSLEIGARFEARVTAIEEDYIFIRIDSQSMDGILLKEEFIEHPVAVADVLPVFFLRESHGDFYFTYTLSAEHINSENLDLALSREIPVWGQVGTETNAGYEVKIGEFSGFCPFSQFDLEKKGKQLTGSRFRFILHEINSKTGRLVLSQKKFSDKERELKREILRDELKVGQYISCQIKSIHNFGLIVDMNGMDALVPASEASFKKNVDLNQEFTIGQTLRGKILNLNWQENKFSISLKDSLDDPWSKRLPFKEGDIVSSIVESIKPFGLFVKFTEHFHGLVPNKESGLPQRTPLANHFKAGDSVDVFITEINPEKRQIAASIIKAKETREKMEYQSYMSDQNEGSNVSSFGLLLKKTLGKK
jgi:ribosomal protein S1